MCIRDRLFTPLTIRLDLTTLPKSQKNACCGRYPHHIICYMDSSKANSKTDYAFSIQDLIVSNRLRNSASVFTGKLNAILACLSHLTHRPPRHNYLLLTDSLSSLQSIRDLESTNPSPPNPFHNSIIIHLHLDTWSYRALPTRQRRPGC